MKVTTINYFISENYIPHWTIEDAYREIYQNFIDYGEYNIDITKLNPEIDLVFISNSFNPTNTDLLIIGESNKSDKQIGKWGEGLKMAALVLLRHNCSCIIYTNKFKATFVLITNESTTIKTLGVKVEEYETEIVNYSEGSSFNVEIMSPVGSFNSYASNIIKPIDIIHTRELYGSIVNKPKGNFYVGNLFVCNVPKLNYAYDIYPKNVQLDRDRKIPSDWDIKYNISKIQETYEEFDKVGKSEDVVYSNVPTKYVSTYRPKLINNEIVFTTKVVNEEGKEVNKIVSNRFNEQLKSHSYFAQVVFKLKQFITRSLGIEELALNFKNKYLSSADAIKDFNILMFRLGIELESKESKENLPF
jgi:hypothetical protein